MKSIVIWSKTNCQACDTAKTLLAEHNYSYEEKILGSGNYTVHDLLKIAPHVKTVPQIFMGEKHVGGLPELKAYLGVN